jgi:hypothetical protein
MSFQRAVMHIIGDLCAHPDRKMLPS